MNRRTVRHPLLVCVLGLYALFCGLAAPAPAQNQAGSISGTLTDPAGAVLRGAQVSIPDKSMIVSSDEQGRFFFSGLQPGDYTISVSYIGFQKLRKTVAVLDGYGVTHPPTATDNHPKPLAVLDQIWSRYDRKELFEKVWKAPMRTVAKEYVVSDSALGKTCKKLHVPVPGKGYWAKKAARKSVFKD